MASYAVNVCVAGGLGYISFYYSGTESCFSTTGSYDRTTGFTSDGSLRLAAQTGYVLDRVDWYRAHGPGEWETIPASDMTYTGGQYRYTVTSDMYNLDSGSGDELWFDAYFIEDTGGEDPGGGDDDSGDTTEEYWSRGTRWATLTGPSSGTDNISAYKIDYVRFTPSVTDTYIFTATPVSSKRDIVIHLDTNTDNRPIIDVDTDPVDCIEHLTYADSEGKGDTESFSYKCTAGKTYVFAVNEYYGNEVDVEWSIEGTAVTSWQDPENIINLSGSSYTTYSDESTINCYNAGRVRYYTPSYKGKLVIQTTSGGTNPDFCGYLSSATLSATANSTDFTRAVNRDSINLIDWDDDGRGIGYDTLISYNGCAATTYYYWYVNAEFQSSGTYTVPWKLDYYRQYTLTYNANGGSGAPSAQTFFADNTTLTLSTTTPSRSGYTFKGWATSSTATSASYSAGSSYNPGAADKTLYAVWSQNTGTITYNANGGSGAPSSQTFTSSPVTLSSTIPTRSGYTFLGWSTNSSATSAQYNAGGSYAFSLLSSTTLYAVWVIATYTVTYDLNGLTGMTIPQQTFNTNNRVVTIAGSGLTRVGYTFLGWSETKTATTASYTAGSNYTLTLKNYTLYAIWKVKTYSISYNANTGSGTISSQTKTYGTNLTLASSGFTKSGYNLSHWNTRSDGTGLSYNLGATYTDVSDTAVVLYAIWTTNEYSLIYNTNGGEGGPGADTKPYGRKWKINITNAPTKANYTFKGWAETSTAITPLYKTKTYPTTEINVTQSNKTLYAVWWPHFEWISPTKEYANQLVEYIKTYLNKTVSNVSDSTSLLYLIDWYNEVASALGTDLLPTDTKIIQQTHLQDLANAFNSY